MKGLLSELDAVNRMLAVAGDSPVQTLEDDYVQAILARQILERTSRTIQGEGWWFNEEENVDLLPSVMDIIILGTNVIRAVPHDPKYIQRGNKLYNKEQRTNTIKEKVLLNSLVIGLDWDDLPNSAREYITAVACMEYNKDFLGDDTQRQALLQNVAATLEVFKKEDIENRQLNIFNNPRINSIAFRNRRRGV